MNSSRDSSRDNSRDNSSAPPTAPPTPRAAFRAYVRSRFSARMSVEEAQHIIDLYDAIPSPNCMDKLYLHMALYRSIKDVEGSRRRETVCEDPRTVPRDALFEPDASNAAARS